MKCGSVIGWDMAKFMEGKGFDYFLYFISFQISIDNFQDGVLKRGKVVPIAFVRITDVQILVDDANDSINFVSEERSSDREIVHRKIFGIPESVFTEHERTVHIQEQRFLSGKHGKDSALFNS